MEFRSVSPILISCLLALTVAAGMPKTAAADEGETLALVDELVIDGESSEVAAVAELSVLRTADGQTEPEAGSKGMPLIAGDEIRTGPSTQAVVRFLDPQAEVAPWLLIDRGSVLRIIDQRSVESILGRLFATLKGLFTVLTPQGQLGVEGTEFELALGSGGSVDVQVLEGSVEIVPRSSGEDGEPAAPTATGRDDRRVQPLQRLTLRPGESTPDPVAMDEPQVRTVLGWTSDLVVEGQPSYVVPQDLPHFATAEDRSRAFREARFEALWKRDPQARLDRGRVYNDWGEGKRAVASYQDAATADPALGNTADFFAGLSQANRRAGLFDRAQQAAESAIERQPSSSRAHQALGNVWKARAKAAENGGDLTAAAKDLDRSLLSYAKARQIAKSAGASRQDRRAQSLAATDTAWSRRKLAAVASAAGDETRAERLLVDAAAEAREAHATDPENPFTLLQQGAIDQDRARLASKGGRHAASQKALDEAERSYRAALDLHPDLAEAHYRLGTVWEDRGPEHRAEAIAAYQRSIRTQPTFSPAYYRLGALTQADHPRAARRYLDVYRKLTPDELEKKPPLPDFRGQDLFAARAAIERQGLRLAAAIKTPHSAAPGTVVDQEPKPGSAVERGADVKLVFAAPQGPISMPDLIGLSEAEARGRLLIHGLESGSIKEKVDKNRTTDAVIQHSPQAGKKVSAGDTVDLVLAVPKGTKVPDLVGGSRKSAEKKLRKRQLVIGKVAQETSCDAAGTVLRQSPDKGRRVLPGSAVDLVTAALGPDSRAVPMLVGGGRGKARQLLEQAELGVNVLYQESERGEGTVLAQNPRPGTRLPPGCPVQLTLAKPIPLVEVPRLVGANFADVQRAFRARSGALAYLTPGQVRQIETRQVAAGTVTRHDPPAGSRVRKGTRINLGSAARPVPKVTVPNLRCQHVEKVASILERLGLRPAFQGRGEVVIRQSPAAGASVPPGSAVTLALGGREQCANTFYG